MFCPCHCARLLQLHVRNITTGCMVCGKKISHYDSLGITPKATQADVKSAYYELSKVYHPDRNKGCEEAAQKFRDISEAYEVLGNVQARKLYDKGMAIGTDLSSTKSQPVNRFYEQREKRTRPSSSGGRQPIYDFDEWSKMHYGATFARDMEFRRRKKMMAQRELDFQQSDRMERVLFIVGCVMVLCVYFFYSDDEYDDVKFIGDASIKVTKE